MQIATHLVSFNNNRQQTVVVKGLVVYTSGTQSLETLYAVTRLIGFLIIIGVGRKFNTRIYLVDKNKN